MAITDVDSGQTLAIIRQVTMRSGYDGVCRADMELIFVDGRYASYAQDRFRPRFLSGGDSPTKRLELPDFGPPPNVRLLTKD
jgi:hypothetical protein